MKSTPGFDRSSNLSFTCSDQYLDGFDFKMFSVASLNSHVMFWVGKVTKKIHSSIDVLAFNFHTNLYILHHVALISLDAVNSVKSVYYTTGVKIM